MGNKISRRRTVIDERYTRPQGLYQHKDVDQRKLRRLILDAKLAPCYPGAEDPVTDLDECPICFLSYPTLNRSKCCMKCICTECFLQMKSPHSARPTQCPFCKMPNYAVEYRGAKTLEEKGVEQAEEQKVIEAKIRIRQRELKDEEERMQRRVEDIQQGRLTIQSELLKENFSNLHGCTVSSGSANMDLMRETIPEAAGRLLDRGHLVDNRTFLEEGDSDSTAEESRHGAFQVSAALLPGRILGRERSRHGPSDGSIPVHSQGAHVSGSSFIRSNREEEFDLDLEDIMVMEAIWLSIQEQSPQWQESSSASQGYMGTSGSVENNLNPEFSSQDNNDTISPVPAAGDTREVSGRSSVTGGLAGAIAALAERQVLSIDGAAVLQIHQSNEAVSETRDESSELFINNCTRNADRALLVVGDSLEEEDIAEVTSAYATPTRTHTQLDKEGDLEGEEIGDTDSKSESEEEGGEHPTWLDLDDNITPDSQDGGQGFDSWIEVSLESGRVLSTYRQEESPYRREESRSSISDWFVDHSSEVAEVGTSFSSSVPSASELPWESPDVSTAQNMESGLDLENFASFASPPPIVPESFEEQIMLAMALSLAEAQSYLRRL